MFAAELTASPASSELGLWMLAAFVVLNGLATLVMLIKSLRNDAEKREVTLTGDAAGKEEFERHAARNQTEHDQLHAKIGGSERATRQALDDKISGLNSQFLTLCQEVGAVKALNEAQNQRIAQIDAKLDRLIERKTA